MFTFILNNISSIVIKRKRNSEKILSSKDDDKLIFTIYLADSSDKVEIVSGALCESKLILYRLPVAISDILEVLFLHYICYKSNNMYLL